MKRRMIALLLSLLVLLGVFPSRVFAGTSGTGSDPVVDSDYDGIPDQKDAHPNDNSFSGTYKSGNYTVNLSYTMDYRNFFGDNTVYNEQIADFSTWAAQFTYENDDGNTKYTPVEALTDSDGSSITKVTHIDQLMRAHGMENVIDYKIANGFFGSEISMNAYLDDDISEAYYGHRKVTYQDRTVEVIAVYIRGTNGTIEEWSSNFNVGNLYRFGQDYDAAEGKLRFPNADWKRKSNHRGFDVAANRIRSALADYVETFADPEATPVFWISGHSRGGAISNILASYLVDEGEKVFAYTFASPNTTANTEASAAKYDCIFNLVNGDDFVPRLPMPEWGFTRYGRTASVFASTATSSQRSNYLGYTSYSCKSDSDLQALCDKFSAMTVNNSGGNDGWRDVNVYHCGHQHADEQTGEYRSGCIRTRGWSELIGWGESMFTGWSQRVQRYAYWSSADSGICETPAYAMQVLAELMGNLNLSGGWDYLTTNKLAERYDFGKTSLVDYASGIIDPHYMENYYLIQEMIEAQGNPDSAYSTGSGLYTDASGRPVHEHSYTYTCYEGMEPTCTLEGKGVKACACSQINASWYDDVVKDVRIPALGHQPGEPVQENYVEPTAAEEGGYDLATYCQRCGVELSRETVVLQRNPFEDVQTDKYYYDPVLWAYYHEPQITAGTGGSDFSPDRTCTRAQILTFLWKAEGSPAPDSSDNPFRDVSDSAYYRDAVLWAVNRTPQITTGVSGTRFAPNASCTRAQVVTFLWRAAGCPEPTSTESPFEDVLDLNAWYYKAVLWALENGVAAGIDAAHFQPAAVCTRAQVVTFLYGAYGPQE